MGGGDDQDRAKRDGESVGPDAQANGASPDNLSVDVGALPAGVWPSAMMNAARFPWDGVAASEEVRDAWSRAPSMPWLDTKSLDDVDASPWMAPLLAFWRRRNAALDHLLYDVGRLTESERRALTANWVDDGAIIVVHPGGYRAPSLYRDAGELAISVDQVCRVVAQATVGATSLGAAAFARNVADALGEPVATINPHFGWAEAYQEMMGGWLFFQRPPGSHTPDADRLYLLLSEPKLSFDLLVGHSRGCVSIAEALEDEREARRHRGAPGPGQPRRLIGFGAPIPTTDGAENIAIVGGADVVGWANMGGEHAEVRMIPAAGHHTNTRLPNHVDVTRILTDLTQELPPQSRAKRKPPPAHAVVVD